MDRYLHKPAPVSAVRLSEETATEVRKLGFRVTEENGVLMNARLHVDGRVQHAVPGDWIVVGPDRAPRVYRPEEFAATFDPVAEPAAA